MPRIYGYNKTFDIDPTMDQQYAVSLRGSCRRKTHPDSTVVALNDVTTPFTFDNVYFRNLQKGLGLLSKDQMLAYHPLTRSNVNMMAEDQQIFFNYFAAAMIKLGLDRSQVS
ncbi:hypothetical protein RCOM_0808690 [Ricinus communis]|uniref:peroxidase n=1 Tax=Ricinus communis TaxID=3988 RepID=B9S4J5_RICCO|nr:hypothetical protein RCOM_0808690 [Ricinus communis]